VSDKSQSETTSESEEIELTVYHFSPSLIGCVLLYFLGGVGLIGTGYAEGTRNMENVQGSYTLSQQAVTNWEDIAFKEGWPYGDPIRINVECQGNPSDAKAMITGNEIAAKYHLPIFAHGNCEVK
jgi:hypothetical protein